MRYGFRIIIILFLVLFVVACVSDRQYNQAILKLESSWKEVNVRTLETEGQRMFKANKQQGFVASQLTARRLGMVVEEENFETGFLLVTSQAPVPLTMQEWEVVQKSDTQEMRSIIIDDVGVTSWFVTLDPSGKDLLANIFISEQGKNILVSIGLRLRDRKAASDRIRRMQPPPTAVRMGLSKFWTVFEKELAAVVEKGLTLSPEPVASKFAQKPAESISDTRPKAKSFKGNPNAIAVIIGNKNYKDRVPPVDFAHNDAEAMKRFVQDIIGVSEGNVIDLRDVTLAEMESVLGNDRTHKGQLWRWVRPRESDVFFFYSGHGVPGLRDGRQYLLPVDGNPDAPDISGYPTELLYKNLDKIEARSVTVLMDACFSGESPKGTLLRAASGIRVAPKEITAVPLTVISASHMDQVASWDNEQRHGLFTKHLLDALYGAADKKSYGNEDSQITLGEIKIYLDREMTYAARRHFGREQQAMVIGDPEKVIVTLSR